MADDVHDPSAERWVCIACDMEHPPGPCPLDTLEDRPSNTVEWHDVADAMEADAVRRYGRCPSIYPPSADAPHDGPGWSEPLRCTLGADLPHDLHWNGGIRWTQPKASTDA